MTYTTNYMLKKPDTTDPVYVEDLNDNADIIDGAIAACEDLANKVVSLSAASTDLQYPSAKCVYDIVGNIEAALDALIGGES